MVKSVVNRESIPEPTGIMSAITKYTPLGHIHDAKKILVKRRYNRLFTDPTNEDAHNYLFDRANEILDRKRVKFMSLHMTMPPKDIPNYLANYAESEVFAENAFKDRVMTSDLRALGTKKRDWKAEGLMHGGKKKGKSRKSSKSSKTRKNRKTRSRK